MLRASSSTCAYEAASVQTGQSDPKTRRSGPKAGNKLNEWTNALKAPVRARFGDEPRNFAIDPWHGGQSLNSAAPFPVHGTGHVRFRNVIENPVQPWCRVNRLDHCIKMAGENQNIERNASTGNLRQRSLKARIGDTCWIVLLQHVPYAHPFRLH